MPDGPTAGPTPARRPGHHGLRRARSQSGLIVALLAVFTICSATAGMAALMLTAGTQRALSAAVTLADGDELGGGADVATMIVIAGDDDAPADAAVLAPLVRQTLLDAAAPYPATSSLWINSPMLFLEGDAVRRGYLLDAEHLADNATLVSGSWPVAAPTGAQIPVAVPQATAAALGLGVGSQLTLSAERGNLGAGAYRLVVTGTFTPSETPSWSRDTLGGRGHDPSYLQLPTFGPFVLAPGSLEALAAPIDRVVAVLDPQLGGDATGIPGLVERLTAVPAQVKDAAGSVIGSARLWTGLGQEFDRLRAELAVTDALVLAVLLLVVALAATTVATVARALADRRGGELQLLRTRGAATARLVGDAAVEAGGISLAAAVLAAPLALACYRLTAPTGGTRPALSLPDPGLVLALLAGAALPGVVLVAATLPERAQPGRALPGRLLRSGADLMLAGVAAVGYLQLRSHEPVPGSLDALLVAAPVACVLAATALSTRLMPLLLRSVEGLAHRGRGFVLPLAGWQLARGGGARGVFLLVLATAVGSFGVTFLATWPQAQEDQAAAILGADLVIPRPGGPGTAQALDEATGGRSMPVADRPVVLGSRPDGVRLVALADSTDRLPVGRPPAGDTWRGLLARLAPPGAATPLVVPGVPTELTITGGLVAGAAPGLPPPLVTATPTLVLVDQAGATTTLSGGPLVLDGRPHTTRVPSAGQPSLPAGPWRILAVDLLLADRSNPTETDMLAWGTTLAPMQISVSVPGATSEAAAWHGIADDGAAAVEPGSVEVSGGTIRTTFLSSVLGLSWEDAHLTLLSFPAATTLPVALSSGLAGELGLAMGDRIALRSGTTLLQAQVAGTVDYVPGRAGEAALLSDLSALQRALLSAGNLSPVTDAWWVAGPRPGAAEVVTAAGLGPVKDRAGLAATLRDGPLRAPLPATWVLAVVAAIGLAVAGCGVAAAADARSRGTTVARVRALGVSSRQALGGLVAQQAATITVGVLLGVACGAVLAALLVPLLITAPSGEAAVPAASLNSPGLPLAGLLVAILVGGLVAGLPAALAVVGRSTAAALRAGEAP